MSTPNVSIYSFTPSVHVGAVLGEQIRDNIMRLRLARGWSRPDLGKRCVPRTSGQQIERLEKGQRGLDTDWIERIARGFGIDPAELVVGDQEQFTLDERVSTEVAASIARVVLKGDEPSPAIVQDLSVILRELSETFARHPQARRDLGAARPVIDLLVSRRAPQLP